MTDVHSEPFREDSVIPLRQRMIQDLQLRGYSDRTVEAYVRSVAQLARFYHASPDTLTEEQLRDYLLHLTTVQKVARGTHTIALCGLKFFYQLTWAASGLSSKWPAPGARRNSPSSSATRRSGGSSIASEHRSTAPASPPSAPAASASWKAPGSRSPM